MCSAMPAGHAAEPAAVGAPVQPAPLVRAGAADSSGAGGRVVTRPMIALGSARRRIRHDPERTNQGRASGAPPDAPEAPRRGTVAVMSTTDTAPPTRTGRCRARPAASCAAAAPAASAPASPPGSATTSASIPVLFRVLFATSAFFGGAGVIAYLIAWAAIPEEGTERAPIDGWVGRCADAGSRRVARRRRRPACCCGWWPSAGGRPDRSSPIVAVVVLLVVFLGRRELQTTTTTTTTTTPTGPVDLTKPGTPAAPTEPVAPVAPGDAGATWVRDARSWVDEARAARRARRRRALPVKVAILVALALTVIVLGIVDAASGIELQVYFWSALGIVGGGLLVGLALRRTPYGLATLLVPAAIGAMAFAGSRASLHDGIGDHHWRPTTAPASSYRLAFGQGTLDLTKLPPLSAPRTIHVTLGAGQIVVDAPKTMNVTVDANVHLGAITADQETVDGHGHGGVNYNRTIDPPTGATGAPLTVVVHVADGRIDVQHR